MLKGVISRSEWVEMKQTMKFDFIEDNHFAELKNSEVLRERLSLLQDVDQYAGQYYSKQWIRKNILFQTDEDIEQMDVEIEDEDDGFGDEEE